MSKELDKQIANFKYYVGGYEVSIDTKIEEHKQNEKNSWGNEKKSK